MAPPSHHLLHEKFFFPLLIFCFRTEIFLAEYLKVRMLLSLIIILIPTYQSKESFDYNKLYKAFAYRQILNDKTWNDFKKNATRYWQLMTASSFLLQILFCHVTRRLDLVLVSLQTIFCIHYAQKSHFGVFFEEKSSNKNTILFLH